MHFFCADATIFFKKYKFFAHKKLKKPPSKVAQKKLNPLFFLTAWAAQTTTTEEFMFQNVAYRPTVYKTGIRCENICLLTGAVLYGKIPCEQIKFKNMYYKILLSFYIWQNNSTTYNVCQ